SRVYVRGAAPPLNTSTTVRPFVQELFFDWTLSLVASCHVSNVLVKIRSSTGPNDRIRIIPEGAMISNQIPKWLSGFPEPARKPDYYVTEIRFESLVRNRAANITVRHGITLLAQRNMHSEAEFERYFDITANGLRVE